MGNSFFGKLSTYDPLNHLTNGKFGQIAGDVAMTVDPVGGALFKKLGNSYSTSSGPGTPGPYANVAPTLADANAGYVRAAAGAAQQPQNNQTSMNNLFGTANPVPRPVGVQPVVPGTTAQRLQPGNLYGY